MITVSYVLEWGVFVFGMVFLGIKNLLQLVKFKDKSFSNIFQIGFCFSVPLLYSFLKGAGINVQPLLIAVTILLFIILILEAISLGEKRKEYESQRVVQDNRGRKRMQPMPEDFRIVLVTFIFNLGAFILAAFQVTGLLEKIFLSM